jgi:hypothetical protein
LHLCKLHLGEAVVELSIKEEDMVVMAMAWEMLLLV